MDQMRVVRAEGGELLGERGRRERRPSAKSEIHQAEQPKHDGPRLVRHASDAPTSAAARTGKAAVRSGTLRDVSTASTARRRPRRVTVVAILVAFGILTVVGTLSELLVES